MTIHEKLTALQVKLKAPKNQYNSFGKYHYRSCEDILEAVKPLLAEMGLSLTITDEVQHISGRFYVVASAILSDGEKEIISTAYAREEESKKGMDGSQITGSASSYARKYALNGLFLIDDTKDADTPQPEKDAEKPQKNAQTAHKQPTRDDLVDACLRYSRFLGYDLYEMKNYLDEREDSAVIERYIELKKQYEAVKKND